MPKLIDVNLYPLSFHKLIMINCLKALVYVTLILGLAGCALIFDSPPAAVKDSDNDGVADSRDLCSMSPAGVVVDATGCSVDNDNDGIINSIDFCPDTPSGVVVDDSGCSLAHSAQKPCLTNHEGSCLGNLPTIETLPRTDLLISIPPSNDQHLNFDTLGSLAESIAKVMEEAKYETLRYFNMPKGIAMVTHLERIKLDGTPFLEPKRWVYGDLSSSFGNTTTTDFLKRLAGRAVGYYRVIAFVVTQKNEWDGISGTPKSPTEMKNMIKTGNVTLPPGLASLPFRNNFDLRVAVYEFKLEQSADAGALHKSGYTVTHHFRKTGIKLLGD